MPWLAMSAISSGLMSYQTWHSLGIPCNYSACSAYSYASTHSRLYRGGKVASAVALDPSLPPHTLSSLIVADIAPFKFSLHSEFKHYLKAMKAVDEADVHDAKTAQQILAEHNVVRRVSPRHVYPFSKKQK